MRYIYILFPGVRLKSYFLLNRSMDIKKRIKEEGKVGPIET